MVSTELLASIDALPEADRRELLSYIHDSLEAVPTAAQQAIATSRLAELDGDPDLGLTLEGALDAARRLSA